MKKIALVTCFLDNYGACLQAYALQKTITNCGNKCTIVNYIEPEGYYKKSFSNKIKNSAVYNLIRCAISKKYKESYKFDKARRKKFQSFRKKFLTFTEEYENYEQLKQIKEFDAFVCGSDQIWNPTFYGKCHPAYYLEFVPESIKKISYAPSIGISDIPTEHVDDFRKYLEKFHRISVREQNGVDLVRKYANRESKWVLDPTMLLSGDEWGSVAKGTMHKKPYILCYLFGSHEYYKDAIEHLRKETGYDVVIIPFSKRDLNKEYHKIYKAGPAEFLSLIKNAEYVLTDSFHATVFSILFGRSFYTLLRNNENEKNGMNSRIYSLLSMVEKQDRCIAKADVNNFGVSQINDYDKVHSKLNVLRQESIEYLTNALDDENGR